MQVKRSTAFLASLVAMGFSVVGIAKTSRAQDIKLPPDQVTAIAKDAYIYGFPLVDNYRVMYSFSVDKSSSEYKGPFNQLINSANVFTPADKTVQTPNSDTPYSFAELDLRSEPMVVTIPPIEKDRYFSVQMVDLYTFNFDYLGTRTTGNGGGDYLIAGPGWKGEAPKEIKQVLKSETELMTLIFRTQLFNPADIDKVRKIQAGYKLRPLSAYLGKTPHAASPAIDFVRPLTAPEERSSLEFFNILNFVLKYCPVNSTEVELRQRFARIGIGTDAFQPGKLSPELQSAFKKGMTEGQAQIQSLIDTSKSSADFFGTRTFLKNDYLHRAVGAQVGIYGNSKEEAFYVPYKSDAEKQPLDGSKNRYILHFDAGKLPPAKAFWSLTMYDFPAQLLVANPINRYLINSPMLPSLKKDADGGVTIYLQADSPGKDKEANWLPAPKGIFFAVLRIYLPKPSVLDGTWQSPQIQRAK
ncbi:MAG: DUF1254 domain-containing protein [Deltaproteobacteria bacterium]|nr:DUF1254 domain-containing protein [Deltaproteobacteria bacterium]